MDYDNDFDFNYCLRPNGQELVIVNSSTNFEQAPRVDVETGRDIGRFPGQPTYVWDNFAICKDRYDTSLHRYPTGELIFKLPSSNTQKILGVYESKVILDYEDRFEIIDVHQSDAPIVAHRRIQTGFFGEKIELVNMAAQGIVAAYHDAGDRSDFFSKLLWIGYDGQAKREPQSFGKSLKISGGMALFEGKVYLELGSRGPMDTENFNLYCVDLTTGNDLWSRVGGGDAIPTKELVYLAGAHTAVDHQGRSVWSDSDKDKDLKRFYEFQNPFRLRHYGVTAECVVQLFWSDSPRRVVLRTLDRFTGRLINVQEIPGAERGRHWTIRDMVCVDFM